ncbi:MAG: hypothetical protein H6740_28070 [Alphaproteobacteria bacterium]|nr:hypothetical protein [Alphaproteobacteria bacterium]
MSVHTPVLIFLTLTLPGCGGCREKDVTADSGPVEIPEITNDVGQYLSMDAFSDGTVAISYYDRTKGGLAFATWNGERWIEERVDGYAGSDGLDPGDRGKYTSLAIDSGDTAWISYYDATNGNLFYARRSPAGEWETGLADTGGGATPNAGMFSSLALDATGNPVVAHYDVNRGQLRVAHYNDGSFSGEVVDEGEDYTPDTGETVDGSVGKYARIAIADGTEYIAYYDAAFGDLKLAVGGAGSYNTYVIDSDGDVGAWPSILIDGGDVWIAYQDVGNQDLKLAQVDSSGNVASMEVIDDGAFIGADSELFLNGSFPAILYFDGNENNLKLAQSNGSEWSVDTVAGADAALGFHNETVVAGGTRYIGCYDYTNRTIWFESL